MAQQRGFAIREHHLESALWPSTQKHNPLARMFASNYRSQKNTRIPEYMNIKDQKPRKPTTGSSSYIELDQRVKVFEEVIISRVKLLQKMLYKVK